MDKNKKALLIGMVLGDGHLNPNSGVALEISHSGKQLEYLEYKRDLLHSLLGGKKPRIHKRKNRDEYKISKGHRYFRIIRKLLYKDRKKIYTRQMLDYLNPQAIALWWMDDGSLAREKTAKAYHFYIFAPKDESQIIIDYFKEVWNINFYMIRKQLKTGTYYYLKCRTKEGRKFSNLIKDWVIPSMQYKIDIEHEQ
jgi:recombination protein RecA